MIHLDIITPDKKVLEAKVESATFPGSNGSFQVLNNHANLISSLDAGDIHIVSGKGSKKSVAITGGVVEVLKNKITVLAEGVVLD